MEPWQINQNHWIFFYGKVLMAGNMFLFKKAERWLPLLKFLQYFSHFSFLSCQYYIAALKNFQVFEEDQCEVRNCEISMERKKMAEADLVLFKTPNFRAPTLRKPKGQVAIMRNSSLPKTLSYSWSVYTAVVIFHFSGNKKAQRQYIKEAGIFPMPNSFNMSP